MIAWNMRRKRISAKTFPVYEEICSLFDNGLLFRTKDSMLYYGTETFKSFSSGLIGIYPLLSKKKAFIVSIF